MKLAIKEARKAYIKEEIPIGAVIVKDNKVLAKAHNCVEKKNNSILHAEIIAISKASKKNHNWRLNGCDMYVTLEPCNMCKSAINLCRIQNVYYSTKKENESIIKESKYILFDTFSKVTTRLLKNFFELKRKK